jgi:hypothetical protein
LSIVAVGFGVGVVGNVVGKGGGTVGMFGVWCNLGNSKHAIGRGDAVQRRPHAYLVVGVGVGVDGFWCVVGCCSVGQIKNARNGRGVNSVVNVGVGVGVVFGGLSGPLENDRDDGDD